MVANYPNEFGLIEHRLFSFISSNWRTEPLRDYGSVVNLISKYIRAKELSETCRLDRRQYPTDRKVSNHEMQRVSVEPKKFHGEWNYMMLELVPFAGGGREVADGKNQCGLIGESSRPQFPESHTGIIASTAVGGDENLLRLGIQITAFKAAPTANNGHLQGSRVMVGADIHKAGIAPQIINAIG